MDIEVDVKSATDNLKLHAQALSIGDIRVTLADGTGTCNSISTNICLRPGEAWA